jgi:hypothetical protein
MKLVKREEGSLVQMKRCDRNSHVCINVCTCACVARFLKLESGSAERQGGNGKIRLKVEDNMVIWGQDGAGLRVKRKEKKRNDVRRRDKTR